MLDRELNSYHGDQMAFDLEAVGVDNESYVTASVSQHHSVTDMISTVASENQSNNDEYMRTSAWPLSYGYSIFIHTQKYPPFCIYFMKFSVFFLSSTYYYVRIIHYCLNFVFSKIFGWSSIIDDHINCILAWVLICFSFIYGGNFNWICMSTEYLY